jgi:signal peptidase I
MPTDEDWKELMRGDGRVDASQVRSGLITDFYAYNASWRVHRQGPMGWQHWVGDLALEADVQIRSDSGRLHLDLVEGGRHHRCEIDVATGMARLTIDDGTFPFDLVDPLTEAPTELTAQTSLTGRGPFRVRFANVDDQLLLWIDDTLIHFSTNGHSHPATYPSRPDAVPQWSPEDPGDLYPLGIAGTDIAMSVHRLAVLRDIYYISPYNDSELQDYDGTTAYHEVAETMVRPESWSRSAIFAARTHSTYKLGPDQFFPMGDNSPSSKDARIWRDTITTPVGYEPLEVEHYVPRDLLIGKAFLVYWPHGLDLGPIPLRVVPNVARMKWIR